MKTIKLKTLFILITIGLSFHVMGINAAKYSVDRFKNDAPNSVVLELNFAEAKVLNAEAIEQLADREIYHIDLVYTAYKENAGFNQDQLNQTRVNQLKSLLPKLRTSNTSWRFIEQTQAQSRTEAQKLFHGFVIHFGENLDYSNLSQFLADYQEPFFEQSISNSSNELVEYKTGSKIHVPANAVTYLDGTPVTGDYTLQYIEFRNPADIVYSGIPMTYNSGQKEYNFNSVGMYEIRAEQDGKELALQKPITVDFNCTEQEADVDFYELDDNTGEWKKKRDIQFEKKEAQAELFEAAPQKIIANIGGDDGSYSFEAGDLKLAYKYKVKNDLVHITFSDGWEQVKTQMEVDNDEIFDIIQYHDPNTGKVRIKLEDHKAFTEFVNRSWFVDLALAQMRGNEINFEGELDANMDELSRTSSTLLAESKTDATHMYPNLVKGLNSDKFGVFNCDQIYRIKNLATISPMYVDAETGRKITNGKVACLLDLTYNGSFSFNPNSITFDAKGRNVIILFTTDKQTYVLSESEAQKINFSNNYRPQLSMKNMTDELQSSSDLSEYLKL